MKTEYRQDVSQLLKFEVVIKVVAWIIGWPKIYIQYNTIQYITIQRLNLQDQLENTLKVRTVQQIYDTSEELFLSVNSDKHRMFWHATNDKHHLSLLT